MKKLLALVLALVMTLGLATVGANAAYKDADSINYKEAVDVMSAIGVLAGDETGFRPTDTLKRSEGAKIIAYLIAGKATADAMTATGTKYTDLPANHWAAGYMEYLSAIGVMGGLGNGRIDPDGSLSATAFAKMLLVALGYDAAIEKMGGDDWQINTQRLANKVGLFDGNSKVVGSAAVTREEAALYALNTIKSPLVEYETKGTSIVVGDAAITTGASNASYMTTTARKTQTIDDKMVNGTSAYIVEFAEQYYPKLVLDTTIDDFGRPANVWTLNSKKVGTFADTADLEYTAAVAIGTIYSDLGITSTLPSTSVSFSRNGNLDETALRDNSGNALSSIAIVKGASSKIGGNGCLTQVYYDSDDRTATITMVDTYFAKVNGVYAATATKDAYVTLSTSATENTGDGSKYETDDAYAVGDYVLYTYSVADNGAVVSMQKAESVQGTLSAYTAGTNVTVDGTVYKANCVAKSKDTISSDLTNAMNTTVTVFKDAYGYAVTVDATAAQDTYAVVLGYSGVGAKGTLSTRTVNLLFPDGTTKTVTAASNSAEFADDADGTKTDTKINTGDIVKYVINSSGEYRLTVAADANSYDGSNDGDGNLIVNGSSSLKGTGANVDSHDNGIRRNAAGSGAYVTYANGGTIFLIKNGTTYTAYKGFAAVPTIKLTQNKTIVTAYSKNNNTLATAIYIDATNATITDNSKDTIYIFGSSGTDASYNETLGTYYEYDAIINGESGVKIQMTHEVKQPIIATNLNKNSKGVYSLTARYAAGATAANDGVANSIEQNDSTNGGLHYRVHTYAVDNGTIQLGTDFYPIADDCQVFRIASNSNAVTKIAATSISEDANDKAWFKVTDGEVTTIVIKTIDGISAIDVAVDNSDPSYAYADVVANAITVHYIDKTPVGTTFNADHANNLAQIHTLAANALQEQGYSVTVWDNAASATGTVKATNGTLTKTFTVTPTAYHQLIVDGETKEYFTATGTSTLTLGNLVTLGGGSGTGYVRSNANEAVAAATVGYTAYAASSSDATKVIAAAGQNDNVRIYTGYVKVTLGANTNGYTEANTTGKITKVPSATAGDGNVIANGKFYRADESAVLTGTSSNVTLTAAMTADDVALKQVFKLTVTAAVSDIKDDNNIVAFNYNAPGTDYTSYADPSTYNVVVKAVVATGGASAAKSVTISCDDGTRGNTTRVGADNIGATGHETLGTGDGTLQIGAATLTVGTNLYQVAFTGIDDDSNEFTIAGT